MIGRSGRAAMLVAVLAGSLAVTERAASAFSFGNSGSITITDSGTPPTPASSYPGTFIVSGVPGTITHLTVTLSNLSHTFPDDIDMLLVGPTGAQAIIMSDVGDSTDANGVTLTLDDNAASSLPDLGPLVSGTFRPTNAAGSGTEAWPAPAPAVLLSSELAAFDGTGPNGTWSLYIVDDEPGDSGPLAGGWSISFATSARPTAGDFDGNGATDKAIYRPSTGQWFVRGGSPEVTPYGAACASNCYVTGDHPVPGDYNGDGVTDKAIYRPTTGQWFIQGNSPEVIQYGAVCASNCDWGSGGDTPVPADYNGDGVTDIAIYRAATGQWFIRNAAPVPEVTQYGQFAQYDFPVPGDYDGDGDAGIAIYRFTTAQWFIRGASPEVIQYGAPGDQDIQVPADYNGDGTTDIAVFRYSTGQWFVRGGAPEVTQYGAPSGLDLPAPADYDGDGAADKAIYRDSTGQFFVRGGTPEITQYGGSGDIPVAMSVLARYWYSLP